MNTQIQSTEALRKAYFSGLEAGRAAAVQILGRDHHGLVEVEAHLGELLEREMAQGRTPAPAYARVVARHRALRIAAREKKQQSLNDPVNGPGENLAPMPSPFAPVPPLSPRTHLEYKELTDGVPPMVQALQSCIRELRGKDREFLQKLVIECDFDQEAFALRTGETQECVATRFHRLQTRLYARMSRKLDDPFGRNLLGYLRSNGYRNCQVVKGLLGVVFEFSDFLR